MKNATDSVSSLISRFLTENDFRPNTKRGFGQDLRSFVDWFEATNKERFQINRMSTADVSGYKDHLHRSGKSISTVNRALVSIRRFSSWLVDEGLLASNPAKKVKELKRQELAPKGLDHAQVRRLLREVELRGDVRASAIFHLLLACLGNPDPVGMKVFAPVGKETFDDTKTTEEAQTGADRREAA